MKTKLTDRTVAAARAEPGSPGKPGKRVELWDEKTPGLCLRVSDRLKTWIYRYRAADGRQPRLVIGEYPSMKLADAQAAARELRNNVRGGADPQHERRARAKLAKAQPLKTFGDLMEAYFKAVERGDWAPKGRKKRESTIADERRNYRVHIEPEWKTTRLDTISKATVRELLRELKAKGLNARANRAHALIRQAFAYAVAEERLAVNPAVGVAPVAVEKARTRVLTDDELRSLWAAVTRPAGLLRQREGQEPERVYLARPMAIIVQLAALLLQRRSELAGMAVAELDLEQSVWVLPPERTKGHRTHAVPLPPRAVKLIREALDLRADKEGAFVFPGQRGASKPLRSDSVTGSFAKVADAVALEGVTLHDLRRTGATALTSERLGISPFVRSLVLGHADAGGGAAVSQQHYDRNSYLAEKRAALTAWEGLLLEIVGERQRMSNVRQMIGSAA